MVSRKRVEQVSLGLKFWGGKRRKAGRPNRSKLLAHTKRPEVKARYPMHVTLKLCAGLPSLRSREPFELFREALVRAQAKGLRVIHYSVQKNHVHLILEAADNEVLTRALKSLCIRFAKKLNYRLKRDGAVFFGRFHLHVLKAALEVRNAIRYVLLNDDLHSNRFHERRDNFSSSSVFDGKPLAIPQSICTEPRSWLLRVAWLKVAWTRLG